MSNKVSWKCEVQTNGRQCWSSNQYRFATENEGLAYARDLFIRWTSVDNWRVVRSEDPVNAMWDNQKEKVLDVQRVVQAQG